MMERSLICINTCCQRLAFVKAFVPDFLAFCQENEAFDFVLALDGNDQDYLDFCAKHGIAIVYSEAREGVGLSKNRVLQQLPDYQHYFFFDDDVELVDGSYFNSQIEIAKATGIAHFSLHKTDRLTYQGPIINWGEHRILQAEYGGAPVNYFSKESLDKIGGWHTEFAKYRRWGHTEHSYRYVNQGLKTYAFHLVETLIPCFVFYDPPSSVVVPGAMVTKQHVAVAELELMEQKLSYFPITTIAAFKFQAADTDRLQKFIDHYLSKDRLFPFIGGSERKQLLSLRLLSQSNDKRFSIIKKLQMVIQSLVIAPFYMTKDKISVIKKIVFNQW